MLLKNLVGKGRFSIVRRAIFRNLELAIKHLKEFNLDKFKKEILVLKAYSHPKVPIFYGSMKNSKKSRVGVVKV
jgi:hypothetical protein